MIKNFIILTIYFYNGTRENLYFIFQFEYPYRHCFFLKENTLNIRCTKNNFDIKNIQSFLFSRIFLNLTVIFKVIKPLISVALVTYKLNLENMKFWKNNKKFLRF